MHMSWLNAPELAKLLPLLSKLDTLKVLTKDYMKSSLGYRFKPVRLLQTQILVVDAQVHCFIKCCTHCQGVTPSNSKGGLPAPEARAHAHKRE